MVQPQPGTRQGPASLIEASRAYYQAAKDHAEAFLLYLNGKQGRTVAEARAMADVDVPLLQREIEWQVSLELTKHGYTDTLIEEFWNADQSATAAD